MVASYLMKKLALTAEDALNMVKKARPFISYDTVTFTLLPSRTPRLTRRSLSISFRPNDGFLQQLKLYEEIGYELDARNPLYRRFVMSSQAEEMRMSQTRVVARGRRGRDRLVSFIAVHGRISQEVLAPDPTKSAEVDQSAAPDVTPSTRRLLKCRKCR